MASYGDGILTEPPKRGISLGVWLGPVIGVALGALLVGLLLSTWRRMPGRPVRVAAEDASATAELGLNITGQPKIEISGREGLVSTRANAGKETTVPVVITNTGTAPAEDIQLSGSAPSGWKVTFDPKTVDKIAPNDTKEVQAMITPPEKAIAGDYVTTLRANWRGDSAQASFRVGVSTSTIWGIYGVGLIGIALLVLVGAVARFGRR